MLKDWIEVELGDICDVVSGKNQKNVENPNGKYPIYGSGGIFGYADDYLCEVGTTIIGRKGTINSPIYVNQKFWNVDTAFGISPLNNIDSKYIHYLCVGFDFKKLDKSTTIPSLAKRDIVKIKFPLAPLSEQRAIAAKIEQLFSELDNGIANLKAAKSKLEIYRFCVLNLAIVNSHLQKIANVVDGLSQGWSPKCREESSKDINEWAVIKTSAIQSGNFIEEENKILPDNLTPREQHEIKVDDILITRAGPRVRVGICCLVRKTRPKLINCDKVYRLRVKNKIILPTYFEYLMNSLTYIHKIEEIKTGGNDSGLNLTQVRYLNIEIPVPSLAEQNQIVQEIETRLSVCDKLNEAIEQSLEKAQALRQSILKKAFEGKLLSQDEIQTCRQQPDWEPAAKLLERVKKDSKPKK